MLFFERDQELYISTVTSGFTVDNTVKIAALAGTNISYSLKKQSAYDYRVSSTPDRLNKEVPIGFSAPTISFSTYTKYSANSSVEKLLLYSLTGNLGIESPGEYTTSFLSVNKLPELYIYLKYDSLIYLLSKMVVKEVNFKFDLNNVLVSEWDLVGINLETVNNIPGTFTDHTNNTNYIKNNFATFKFIYGSSAGSIPIISGNLKIINDVEIVERNVLSTRGTELLTHYASSRRTKLNMLGYLKTGNSGNISNYELFNLINSNIDFSEDNILNSTLNIGKSTESKFRVLLPKAQILLPQIKTQDVISSNIEVNSATNSTINDDIIIKYLGV